MLHKIAKRTYFRSARIKSGNSWIFTKTCGMEVEYRVSGKMVEVQDKMNLEYSFRIRCIKWRLKLYTISVPKFPAVVDHICKEFTYMIYNSYAQSILHEQHAMFLMAKSSFLRTTCSFSRIALNHRTSHSPPISLKQGQCGRILQMSGVGGIWEGVIWSLRQFLSEHQGWWEEGKSLQALEEGKNAPNPQRFPSCVIIIWYKPLK